MLITVNCLLRVRERGILQIRDVLPKAIGWHFTKTLPHTSNKRSLISIPLFSNYVPCKGPSWSWSYGSLIYEQSLSITNKVAISNPFNDEVYLIQHYMIKFVSYMR
jgi:hypothetical protein